MHNHFIIFDLEYTTWEGAMDRGWTGENEYPEIAQIGALKVDKNTFAVIDTFNLLVSPKYNPKLSEFFQKLTGITQEQMDRNGLPFPEAHKQFSDFCGHSLVFSYGNDMVVLGEILLFIIPILLA